MKELGICTYMHIYTYVCTYIYIYTHTHTHTHIIHKMCVPRISVFFQFRVKDFCFFFTFVSIIRISCQTFEFRVDYSNFVLP